MTAQMRSDKDCIIGRLRAELDSARHDLAVCRQEFAAEVQKVQGLERRLMLAQESSLATIGALVEELQKK